MPRTAKRTQTPQAAAGQAYGERQAQMAAQEAVPLPQAPPPGVPAGGGQAGPPAGPQVDPMAGALEAALGMPAPEPPPWAAGPVDENIHAGLPTGPGPGPEALRGPAPVRTPVADVLFAMARATGDTRYADMALKAQA